MLRLWSLCRVWRVLAACILVGMMTVVSAQNTVEQVVIYAVTDAQHSAAVEEPGLYLDAAVEFSLSPELQEVAAKGVPLYFTADVEVYEQRWWWFDKTVLKAERTWKLVYSPLTQQWRIGTGDLLRPEETLEDALLSLRRIRRWRIGEVALLRVDKPYLARFRLRLDSSLLSRPFQVDLLNRTSWSLETPWYDFQFSISAAKPHD